MYGITNAGGGSGTKSTLIISIDSGSTVKVYSNSTYTTLVKTATEKTAGQFWVKGLDNGTYYIKATKSGQTATMAYTIAEYGVYRLEMAYRSVPIFTYTGGTYEVVQDDDTVISDVTSYVGDWKIRFITSGTLNFSRLISAEDGIDIFAVGGGGNGAKSYASGSYIYAGGGGGGGHTETVLGASVVTNNDYAITVGDALGASSFDSLCSAYGGESASSGAGGSGGSGGGNANGTNAGYAGGSDGATPAHGGAGQGTTTREFGEANAKLYAGGGSGGSYNAASITAGGAGGGGDGGNKNTAPKNGTANSGGGGGGSYTATIASGGSGIVIIRNARS